MVERNYDFIVRMKQKGDFDTIFATKVEGNMGDPFVTVYIKTKEGVEKKLQVSTSSIEQIEEILS